MPVDPAELLAELDPTALPSAAPPDVADYREAELAGVTCAFCSKFSFGGMRAAEDGDGEIPIGICSQWEALVDGVHICDRFASGTPTFDSDGMEVWDVALSAGLTSPVQYHEIHMAGGAVAEHDGLVRKGLLRTGHWDVTPTPFGKIDKPLTIIRDGKSDIDAGILSLSEIEQNFKSRKPIKRVQVPFTDKANDDHIRDGNMSRVNTGFVENVWIEDEDGVSHLVGDIRFTDGTVKKMVLDGSLEDGSAGIPIHPQYGAFMEHFCVTNTPFIDDLKPYLAASDTTPEGIKEAEIVHHVLHEEKPDEKPAEGDPPADETTPPGEQKPPAESESAPKHQLSYAQIVAKAATQLREKLGLSSDYVVQDATNESVTIVNTLSETTWTATYTVEGDEFTLAAVEEWKTVEGDAGTPEPPEATPPPPRQESTIDPMDDELEAAHRLREMRVTASAQLINPTGGDRMAVISREELDRLELSDEARAAFQSVLDENSTLTGKTREQEATSRLEELKGYGFTDRPGALKLYRRVFLADDKRPAIVLFSDEEGKTDQKESLTALEILDKFIDGLRGAEGKVTFSDQHVEQPGDEKPPSEDGDKRPVGDRVKDARDFLYPNGR